MRLLMALFGVTVVAYHAITEHVRGQTFGKILLHIETRTPDGGRPSLCATAIRNAWYLLFAVPTVGPALVAVAAGAIAVSIASSSANSGLHDRLAGGTSGVQQIH